MICLHDDNSLCGGYHCMEMDVCSKPDNRSQGNPSLSSLALPVTKANKKLAKKPSIGQHTSEKHTYILPT